MKPVKRVKRAKRAKRRADGVALPRKSHAKARTRDIGRVLFDCIHSINAQHQLGCKHMLRIGSCFGSTAISFTAHGLQRSDLGDAFKFGGRDEETKSLSLFSPQGESTSPDVGQLQRRSPQRGKAFRGNMKIFADTDLKN